MSVSFTEKAIIRSQIEPSPVPLLQRLELLSDDGGEGATDDRTGHPVLSQAGGEQVDVARVVVDAEVGGPTGFYLSQFFFRRVHFMFSSDKPYSRTSIKTEENFRF